MISISQVEQKSLSETRWDLLNGDETLIASGLYLDPSGQIRNSSHPNESSWLLCGDHLMFLGYDGAVTSVFDQTVICRDLRRCLQGRFTGDGRKHILREQPIILPDEIRLSKRSAVLIRCHLIDDKVLNLFNILRRNQAFDTFILLDETRGEFDLDSPFIVRHKVSDFHSMSLSQSKASNYMWYFSDYPLYFAEARLEEYDVFCMIEYDVDLERRNGLAVEVLLSRFCELSIDFAASYVGPRDENWMWTSAAKARFQSVFGCLFPIVIVSRSALAILQQHRIIEAEQMRGFVNEALDHQAHHIFCEAFVPSTLIENGLKILDLNSILPNAYEPSSFHPNLPFPMERGAIRDNREFVHPVYSYNNFLKRHIEHAKITKDTSYILDLIHQTSRDTWKNQQIGLLIHQFGFDDV